MLSIFQGQRPDITPAQVVALLVGGVPVVANLLSVFGVYDLSAEQQDALTKTLQWGGLVAIGLFGADAGLRAARGHAEARVRAMALSNPSGPAAGPTSNDAGVAPSPGGAATGVPTDGDEEDLPTDDEEFASQPGAALATPEATAGVAENPVEPDDGDQGPESRQAPAVPDDIL